MAIFEIRYQWYNPRRPKCRNCFFWDGEDGDYYQDCSNKKFKGQKIRAHNSKACVHFKLDWGKQNE